MSAPGDSVLLFTSYILSQTSRHLSTQQFETELPSIPLIVIFLAGNRQRGSHSSVQILIMLRGVLTHTKKKQNRVLSTHTQRKVLVAATSGAPDSAHSLSSVRFHCRRTLTP